MGSRGRKVQTSSRSRVPVLVAMGVLAVAGVAAAIYFLREDSAATAEYHPVSSFSDVHGLAVSPDRPSETYVATHHGLIRGVNDGSWARVGAMQDDLMGFSMHPTNGSTFFTSGHPRAGGNMGVRVSRDGGFTWDTIALKGQVDFHAMTVSRADPERLWGYFRGQVHRSDDAGRTWSVVSEQPPQILTLAADPASRDGLWAAGPTGIHRSVDGGTTWTTIRGGRFAAVAVDPREPRTVYASTGGGVERSADDGVTWTRLGLDPEGGAVGYLAVAPSDPRVVYAATYETAIHKTTDGGATWSRVKAPR